MSTPTHRTLLNRFKLPVTSLVLLSLMTGAVHVAKAAPILGHDIEIVNTPTVSFRKIGNQWAERDIRGHRVFYFREVGRSNGRITIYDNPRFVALVIDLNRGVITYSDLKNQRQRDLYRITSTVKQR